MEEKNMEEKNRDLCDTFSPSAIDFAAMRVKTAEVNGLAEVFKALGDETRTKILYLLAQQPLCVCDLATILEMTLPAVSHHLRLLKAMRLVKYVRDGKMVYYSLDDDHVSSIIKQGLEHINE